MADPHRMTGIDPDDESHDSDSSLSDDSFSDSDSSFGFNQARATYESLVNTLPLCLLIKDRQGHRVFANNAYLEFRGSTLDDLLGKRDEDLFPPAIAKQFTEDDQRVMDSGSQLHDVEETIDAAGQKRWIERIKRPIVDQAGQVIGIQLLFWDVTDRVLAEQELKHERDLLTNLLRHIPDSIYFKDKESRFIRISDAMADKFQLPSTEAALGRTDADIFSEEHAQGALQDELEVMRTRKPLVDRVEKETWRDREDTWVLSTKMPFIDDNGEVMGTFGISRDITELKKYQDELREARDSADQANRAKSDFLANMSHEIRTPMNAVIGMSELLAQTELNDEQREYVQLVRDSADSLLRLLNDILDFSKIEARKLELETVAFSLRDLVEKTGRTLTVPTAEKGLEMACRVDPDLPDRLLGDPGRLRQILINLIGNAVKFTDEGEVVVDVSPGKPSLNAPPGTVPVRFSVRDTGIGIPEEKRATVIEPFTQADSTTTRRFGGTGLGLAISKQLVELMHGKLSLESEVGRGTEFFFTAHFPIAPAVDQDPTKRLRKLGHLPVLVVDDNPTNRKILKEILSTWQFEPAMAEDGESALAQVEEAEKNGTPFPLAILDCMMPEMDGFELAQRIRQRWNDEQTKLIILSSASRSDDAERCAEFGISRYMTKPVVQSELLETVLQVMGMQPEPMLESGEDLPTCPPMRVLVAEDGIANQHVAVGMLNAAGHRAVVASDGRETVARWRDEPFDVILMDMHMPVMDGIEATAQIRAEEAATGAHVPIIALTAAAMQEDAEACQRAGMDEYLTKPIQRRALYEMLARFAPETPSPSLDAPGQATSVAEHNQAVGPGELMAEKLAGSELASDDAILDFNAAASRIPGGLKGVRRLAEIFVPECESLLETLVNEIPDGDVALVQRTAHTLKGSADLFAAQNVHESAYKIELIAKDHDLRPAVSELQYLRGEVASMLRALRNFIEVTSES